MIVDKITIGWMIVTIENVVNSAPKLGLELSIANKRNDFSFSHIRKEWPLYLVPLHKLKKKSHILFPFSKIICFFEMSKILPFSHFQASSSKSKMKT